MMRTPVAGDSTLATRAAIICGRVTSPSLRAPSRDDVRKGAEELGIPLEEHIVFCIAAMRGHADALGLRGSL